MRVWVRSLLASAVLLGLSVHPGATQTSDLVSKNALRICADPANLPASDKALAGYENRIASLLGEKLGLPVEYTWFPMATGFIRNTLRANKCDLVVGYAQGHELVLNSNHYLTSAFVLIVPADGALTGVETLSDTRLRGLKLGVIAGSPPASHLARNGMIGRAKPYDLMVDRRHQSPAIDMLDDLQSGEIDGAILWGPIGGPLVKSGYPEFAVTPLIKETLPPRLVFRITMGVRQGEKVWARKINSLLRRNRKEINAVLNDAGVPILNDMGTARLEPVN